jgi:hypothetical protein
VTANFNRSDLEAIF